MNGLKAIPVTPRRRCFSKRRVESPCGIKQICDAIALHGKKGDNKMPKKRLSYSRKDDNKITLSWKKETIGVPNVFARSGVFSVASKHSESSEEIQIPAMPGFVIYSKGPALNTYDELVFFAIITLIWQQDCDEKNLKCANLKCTVGDLAAVLGRNRSIGTGRSIFNSLLRLSQTYIRINYTGRSSKYGFSGSLISLCYEMERDDTKVVGNNLNITLNPKLQELYMSSRYTALDWKLLLKLRRDYLALWLMIFLLSHKSNSKDKNFNEFVFGTEKLQEYSGSKMTHHKFDYEVPRRLAKIKDISSKLYEDGYGFDFTCEKSKTGRLNVKASFKAVKEDKVVKKGKGWWNFPIEDSNPSITEAIEYMDPLPSDDEEDPLC